MNQKSDVEAKQKYADLLKADGYKVEFANDPVDIIAEKDGKKFYFEIKYTRQKKMYFGAATLTEWEAAVDEDKQDSFYFVVASRQGNDWKFVKYTPKEFMSFSYIPPFKIFFLVPVDGEKDGPTATEPQSIRRVRRVQLTTNRLNQMIKLYKEFKKPLHLRPSQPVRDGCRRRGVSGEKREARRRKRASLTPRSYSIVSRLRRRR
jgi:hypothetical protein